MNKFQAFTIREKVLIFRQKPVNQPTNCHFLSPPVKTVLSVT
ncbi:hypothetical protein ADIS_4828 [Lunatimonas lonarensis]|uniref:Uncharacterized protein n=1 Tax=Lunatimonas lonarensis TaxID=1232681 RepID=R7ZKW5_9BACT|nr:hypothetical protein ADIS_4828 [Lunatimonas lonarensis]